MTTNNPQVDTRSVTMSNTPPNLELVEQNVQQALKISDRAYILDQGEIVFHDTAQNLLNNDEIQQKYCAV